VREIRSVYPILPIVVASGQSEACLQSLSKDVPSVVFVRKPYSQDELREAIRAAGIPC
jgi:FixJ family two-component response regulator